MTDGNGDIKADIDDELVRAGESLRVAEALVPLGLYSDAVSRAYYAAYHALRALLRSRGVEPKTYAGAIHLFNTEFIREGKTPTSHNRLLGSLQRARELADYDAAVRFEAEDAEAEIASARTFVDAAAALLASEES